MKPSHPIFVAAATLFFGWVAVAIEGHLSQVKSSSEAALIVAPMWQKQVDMKISDNSRAIAQDRVHLAALTKAVDQQGWKIDEFAKAQHATQTCIKKIEREVTKLRIEAAKQTAIISSKLQLAPTQSPAAN
jgi:microcompartment protein CcmL/EutN